MAYVSIHLKMLEYDWLNEPKKKTIDNGRQDLEVVTAISFTITKIMETT